ncbi:type II toxin-antitoxin system prevent-host-death family antitoxin [Intrasporangium sp.]|uniref:type II toxin-antitoxin system Phd/YefM family antitoxin n=1 Tax=Intrasporangium sp. TaxID=1925024 RepID=UPI003365ABC2
MRAAGLGPSLDLQPGARAALVFTRGGLSRNGYDRLGSVSFARSASELVRRVEKGEHFVITVAGRPSALLVTARPSQWRSWPDLQEPFRGPADTEWATDRDLVDDTLRNPWAEE